MKSAGVYIVYESCL